MKQIKFKDNDIFVVYWFAVFFTLSIFIILWILRTIKAI